MASVVTLDTRRKAVYTVGDSPTEPPWMPEEKTPWDHARWGWIAALAVAALGAVLFEAREVAALERGDNARGSDISILRDDVRELRTALARCKPGVP
jgi:hypothetical protein